MFLKGVSFGSKECTEELKLESVIFWARLASFGHLGYLVFSALFNKQINLSVQF